MANLLQRKVECEVQWMSKIDATDSPYQLHHKIEVVVVSMRHTGSLHVILSDFLLIGKALKLRLGVVTTANATEPADIVDTPVANTTHSDSGSNHNADTTNINTNNNHRGNEASQTEQNDQADGLFYSEALLTLGDNSISPDDQWAVESVHTAHQETCATEAQVAISNPMTLTKDLPVEDMILGEEHSEESSCEEMVQWENYPEEEMIFGEKRDEESRDALGLEDVDQVEIVPGDYRDQDVMISGEDHAYQMLTDTLDLNFNGEDLILEDDSGNQPTAANIMDHDEP
ncbi:hypothetical protein P692DRAFT_20817576 [Suillus brevipes Sb2]|nr:hypothetical protein P692DRAFT_20817576 [Suillus brevipes Sb2]